MSRLGRYLHSLASGYVLLGANILYTLASLRLANKFLSPAEFGLWAVTTNIAQYLALVDFGMGSTCRILVDYKDQKDGREYGSVIQTFVLVSLVQSCLLMLLGVGLALGLVPLLRIPAAQQQEFVYLMIGQCGLVAGTFLSRILHFLLAAHQRFDVTNYTQAILFAVSFGVMWLAFKTGQGVYSTLSAQLVSWLPGAMIAGIYVLKLRLLPAKGCWGHPTLARFRELFKLGSDMFLFALGSQLLTASQTLVLTRVIGLEASALWSVCTKAFTVVSQVIYRMLDYSSTALAEMLIRGEKERLYGRFRSMVILSASLSVYAGTIFVVCNQPFVRLWLGGKYSWSPLNDALLAVWLIPQAVARCHLGLVGITKDIRSMRYIYAIEGCFFVILSLAVVRQGGISALLLCSIAGTLLFSTPYGFWRTSRYLNIPFRAPALGWWVPTARFAGCLVPVAGVAWWLSQGLPLRPQMLVCGAVAVLAGLPLLLRFGLDEHLRQELLARAPAALQPLVRRLAGLAGVSRGRPAPG